jgi:hypothetical protein
MPPPTRKPTVPPTGGSGVSKPKEPELIQDPEELVLTISIGGPIRQVPDMTGDLAEFILWNGRESLGNHWSFMRVVEATFARERRIRIIEGWVRMDDGDFIYYVRASRTNANSAVSKYEVIGAADIADVNINPATP